MQPLIYDITRDSHAYIMKLCVVYYFM